MLDRLKKVFASWAPAAMPGAAPAAVPAHGPTLDVNVYATSVQLPPVRFPHRLEGARNRLDPDLAEHLQGFAEYVARRGDGATTPVREHLLGHIRRTRWHANLLVEAGHAEAFSQWAARANAILFMADGSVRDPQGRLLVARDGSGDAQALVPVLDEARSRRARTDASLDALGIELAPPRTPGASALEVQLHSPADVVHRALALLLVTERTQALWLGAPMPVEALHRRLPAARRHLTPSELAFVSNAAPPEAERQRFAHAHEALAVLAWALLRADAPTLPALERDAARISGVALRLAAENRAPRQLRPVEEILDALDLHARAADGLRAAAAAGREAPSALHGEVVRERLRALEWLVRADDPRWDDGEADTCADVDSTT
jgi:hypothetical protein